MSRKIRRRLPQRPITSIWSLALIFAVSPAPTYAVDNNCLDEEDTLAYWHDIREQATTAELAADALALELVSCLGSENPELRDRIGFELLTYWLRQEKLSNDTRKALLTELTARLGDTKDDAVLSRSFSALVLSEVLRSDSIEPFMTGPERDVLLNATIVALAHETDFRGLDAVIGWVHPVAHMSDILWRFALHPDTTAEQARVLLDAVRSKVAPVSAAYSFGESDRLSRVVVTVIQRDLVGAETVADWVRQFETPQSMEKWSEAYQSPQGMTELHNTRQFLRALSDQLQGVEVDPLITGPLTELVKGFTQLL